MSDPLFELLAPYLDPPIPHPDTTTAAYLTRLTTLPLAALSSSEQLSLQQTSQSTLRSLQALAKRSHAPIISSAEHLSHLRQTLPQISHHASRIHTQLPALETTAQSFATKYNKSSSNPLLDRRRKALQLSRNIDRVSDILDLPTLLSSAISSSTAPSQATSTSASTTTANANYASALDLYAHIRRLQTLYPKSELIASLASQAEQEMRIMTSNLISSLQSPTLKLASAMRTIGWLRRVAPELDASYSYPSQPGLRIRNTNGEGSLGMLFLSCRLSCLENMLQALDPLRELADQEKNHEEDNQKSSGSGSASAWGQQTDRYLKRYIEIFREQSFAVVSMYKSIFPSALPPPSSDPSDPSLNPKFSDPKSSPEANSERLYVSAPAVQPPNPEQQEEDQHIPSPLATFSLHLTDLLFSTLRIYLPRIRDRASRDSLLTQVLYCAGSLGRLGADFSLGIAVLEEDLRGMGEDDDDEEGNSGEDEGDGNGEGEVEWGWIDVMKKHRIQASRLELLASGVSTGRTSSFSDRSERTGSPVRG